MSTLTDPMILIEELAALDPHAGEPHKQYCKFCEGEGQGSNLYSLYHYPHCIWWRAREIARASALARARASAHDIAFANQGPQGGISL